MRKEEMSGMETLVLDAEAMDARVAARKELTAEDWKLIEETVKGCGEWAS